MKNLPLFLLFFLTLHSPAAHAYRSVYQSFEFDIALSEQQTEDTPIHADVLVQKDKVSPVIIARISFSDSSHNTTKLIDVREIGPSLLPEKGRRVWMGESKLRIDLCEEVSALPACSGSSQHILGLGYAVSSKNIRNVSLYTNGLNSALRTLSVTLQVEIDVEESAAMETDPSLLNEDSAEGLFTKRHYFLNSSAQQSVALISSSLEALSERDVIGYFGLRQKYDTPLKKRVFKRSKEYKKLRKVLASARRAIVDGPRFCHHVKLGPYDLKRKGFRIEDGIRFGKYTLDVRYLGRNTSRELKGLRDFIRTNESVGIELENAGTTAMCFKVIRLAPKTRTHRYRPDPKLIRLFPPAQRAFFKKNPLKTVFREYRVEATHFVIGALGAPTKILRIRKGRITP